MITRCFSASHGSTKPNNYTNWLQQICRDHFVYTCVPSPDEHATLARNCTIQPFEHTSCTDIRNIQSVHPNRNHYECKNEIEIIKYMFINSIIKCILGIVRFNLFLIHFYGNCVWHLYVHPSRNRYFIVKQSLYAPVHISAFQLKLL